MNKARLLDPTLFNGGQSRIVQRAIASASRHGVTLCQGRLNPAKGDCAFEASIFNNNDRSCFNEKFAMSIEHYRKLWISEGENTFFDSDFNPGYSLKDWKNGFKKLKKLGVYEVDFFGDFVIPSIAVGMKRIILIFNTNTNTPREPVTLVHPAQYGVVPTSKYPIVLAYDISHYESMHPKSTADDMKCIELVRLIREGNYLFSHEDLSDLVNLTNIISDYALNDQGKKVHLNNNKSTKNVPIIGNIKKKIKDMDIEERRRYNREKYKERQEKLSKEEKKKQQEDWKERKSACLLYTSDAADE